MMHVRFTAQDMARVQFAAEPSPITELLYCLHLLRRRDGDPRLGRWRRAALRALPPTSRPLWDLVVAARAPTLSGQSSATVEEGLATIEALSGEQFRMMADVVYGQACPPALIPAWVRALGDNDRAARHLLLVALRDAHRALFEEAWPQFRARHHQELARRSRDLALHGTAATLAELVTAGGWDGATLTLESARPSEKRLDGRGLVILPSILWDGPPQLTDIIPDEPPVLVYGIGGPLPPMSPGLASDPLVPVLGNTRAAILRLLTTEQTAPQIAAHLRMSPSSVSEHLTALREANLVVTRRDGRTNKHRLSVLGEDLTATNGYRSATWTW
jgi:DNA-binding transcriptional ArsR family regulator